ncbi:diiron oxygenase [Streptomyces sp. JB150]|uniref:diiron oxygenase n=1 Tax=Streptomyces sp. JB150 TaxID=2714844 RepID=UPI0014073367|nr:diiron oxygenase [Streptomyces sp. JB150]QIJ66064.1 diiron oxygenase [Streptomyces sp. JB150]
MATIEEETGPVGPSTLRRLAAAWPRRATVRTDMDKVTGAEAYDPALLDYPLALMPFGEHPDFQGAPEDKRRLVNTLGWIAYNERVVAAEEFVVNPTFEKLGHAVYPGVDRFEVKEIVRQSHIDEVWHTYMHMLGMQRTREARGITAEPDCGHPVTNRLLYEARDAAGERWEADLLYLLWTTVGEVSVNAFLDLMARDTTVQPMHATIARLHARDESAHGPVMVEVMKDVFVHLDSRQRDFFVRSLPAGITAFCAEDFDWWLQVLEFAGVRKARDIVEDSRGGPHADLLVTDFSGILRMLRELGVEDRVEFDFAGAAAAGTSGRAA